LTYFFICKEGRAVLCIFVFSIWPFANNGLLNVDAISRAFVKICAVTIWIVNKNITPGDVRQ